MSDRLANGQFPPGLSGNPGGKRRGPTLSKTVRLLLLDDPCAWAAVREIESDSPNTGSSPEGSHEMIKLAVSVVRRARTDNTVLREVFDRVDGKLAAAYMLPDDDDRTQIVRPVLYVAPPEAEKGKAVRLFAAFDVDGPEPETGSEAETQPGELAETKERAAAEGAAATPSNGRPEPLFRAFDIAGHELEIGHQAPTLPPVGDRGRPR